MKKLVAVLIIAINLLSCVQEEYNKTITFLVDTNGIENIKSLGIRGDFLPTRWSESIPMTDENNDGVYEITFKEKTAIYGISFKFVKNGFDYELKNQDNREIVFEYKPETIIYKTTFNKPENEIIRK